MLRLIPILAGLFLAGCLPPIFPDGPPGPRAKKSSFEPYTVYVEALVAEEPEAFAPFVRDAMAGTVIVGEAPAPPDAQYVARLRSHPAGTHLRIERRLTEAGFYDGTQLSELYLDAVRAWEGDEEGYPQPHRTRYVPQASATTCITDTTATGLAPPPDPPELEDEEETFIVVEQPPALVGGLRALQKRIRYPELARRKGIEGLVMTTFVVDEQGNVPCIDIVNGLPYGINEEVLAAVQDLEFRPGTQRGEPVKVRFSLPVKFRLR
jgi:TonB family protein